HVTLCLMCGFREVACPPQPIQLTPDIEMADHVRLVMVWEKEHMLIDGTGKYHDYNFYHVAGKAIGGKDKGEARNELPPTDRRSLLP
ncbi:MAG: NADH-quinone oxidoreductase subunit I, partial [Gammaproteobacteria bacterium]